MGEEAEHVQRFKMEKLRTSVVGKASENLKRFS